MILKYLEQGFSLAVALFIYPLIALFTFPILASFTFIRSFIYSTLSILLGKKDFFSQKEGEFFLSNWINRLFHFFFMPIHAVILYTYNFIVNLLMSPFKAISQGALGFVGLQNLFFELYDTMETRSFFMTVTQTKLSFGYIRNFLGYSPNYIPQNNAYIQHSTIELLQNLSTIQRLRTRSHHYHLNSSWDEEDSIEAQLEFTMQLEQARLLSFNTNHVSESFSAPKLTQREYEDLFYYYNQQQNRDTCHNLWQKVLSEAENSKDLYCSILLGPPETDDAILLIKRYHDPRIGEEHDDSSWVFDEHSIKVYSCESLRTQLTQHQAIECSTKDSITKPKPVEVKENEFTSQVKIFEKVIYCVIPLDLNCQTLVNQYHEKISIEPPAPIRT